MKVKKNSPQERKGEDQFKENPAIPTGLNLVAENYQYTHMLTLNGSYAFEYNEYYEQNEKKYKVIRERILDENESNSFPCCENRISFSDSDDEGNRKKDNVNEEEKEKQQQTIIDETQTNLAMLREEMYSIVQTNITPEQCAYK
ncbi:unnamed protein product [Rotaria sp. Silwood2]|nr:unnamed protein product [Rotaria sp. Silwood2]CAF2663119.1 unnamed protein product [Rotaria sp. Silwood2]CAF3009185.1 unnamed protein product [Rotaria sp. Silwood2]CAF3911648.1 unnamed protein product [Rotaria sp. Silwood2]CAF4046412.1 unnamed protein product [Rotaria sp. Silwood2]